MYPKVGKLYPSVTGISDKKGSLYTSKLAQCVEYDTIKGAVEAFPEYKKALESLGADGYAAEQTTMDKEFDELEVNLNRLAFEQQFHYGMYYAYVKLKEQEIRNIVWIADCISQDQKGEIDRYMVNIF